MTLALTLSSSFAFAEVSTSDPLWDWKYDAIERLSLATGENTVLNTRPISRLEMAGLVQRIAAKVEVDDNYYKVLLKRLEEDLSEEIKGINEGPSRDLSVKPLRWVRAKAVHTDSPVQLENDYGFKGGNLSIRGEASTSGTWGFLGYELRPQYNLYRDDTDEDKLDLHSGYVVAWLKNIEIEVGRDSLWWGPGRRGNWVLTNNAPAFEMIKLSNAVTTIPPGPLSFMGNTRFTAFLGRLSEQEISYIDNGAPVTEAKKPLFAGFRLNFSPSRYVEIGGAQTVEFIDRGGRGYSLDYISKTLIPSYGGNEEEALSGPVANRITSMDLAVKIDGQHDFMKFLGLEGMKIYWEVGGESVTRDMTTNVPRFANTSNIFGLYLDTGRTDFRAEYASTYDASTKWYDHYQFTEGYRNEGFVLGHPQGAGNRKDLFLSISHPVTDSIVPRLHFERKDWHSGGGQVSVENDFGLSVDLFGKRGEKIAISYEYRDSDSNASNNIWMLDMLYRF
ncbi:MAG: capsule assembly Wzi family protein [Deltaproteobacteria bacterium]|nr:capsule assembly Wzi family protein [Deltaproteobacteria bacterium]